MVRAKRRRKGQIKDTPPPAPAQIVFYGDFLWPAEAKKAGGFLPPLARPPGPKYDVENFIPDPAVEIDWTTEVLQTHQLFGAAAQDAAEKASKATDGFHGIVYAVHTTPNMLLSGMDSIAIGCIRWSQVLGWIQVPLNYTQPEESPQVRAGLRKNFENAFKDRMDLFQKNDDYDHKFDKFTASGDIPNFALPQGLIRFMDKNGKAVGWTGAFPLFEAPERITAHASKEAKASKAVMPPHEPGFWEKVGHYMRSHVFAMAMLPAVVVANFIPGLGELADGAELAALSTEAVEGIELGEASSSGASGLTRLLQSVARLKYD